MPRFTTVLFSGEGSGHGKKLQGADDPKLQGHSAQTLKGTPLVVHLPPEKPDSKWECGTNWVWRVADKEIIRLCGRLPDWGHICVCEHQIELD